MTAGHRDDVLRRLLPHVLTHPVLTAAGALAAVGGWREAVDDAFTTLVHLGDLTVTDGFRANRLFRAEEVLDLFDHHGTPRPDGASPT